MLIYISLIHPPVPDIYLKGKCSKRNICPAHLAGSVDIADMIGSTIIHRWWWRILLHDDHISDNPSNSWPHKIDPDSKPIIMKRHFLFSKFLSYTLQSINHNCNNRYLNLTQPEDKIQCTYVWIGELFKHMLHGISILNSFKMERGRTSGARLKLSSLCQNHPKVLKIFCEASKNFFFWGWMGGGWGLWDYHKKIHNWICKTELESKKDASECLFVCRTSDLEFWRQLLLPCWRQQFRRLSSPSGSL